MTAKLRVLLLEDDPSLSALLKTVLSKRGHQVMAFTDPTACPVFVNPECKCPQEFPCADVVISDITMPNMTGVEFFKLQRERGCKALDANKALMSAANQENLAAVDELGCHFFKKPFRLAEIISWVDECATRVPEGRILAQSGNG